MSRRNPSAPEILIQLPWQISAFLSVAVFASIRWGVPTIEVENIFLKPLVSAAPSVAWIPALFFAMLAAISAFLARRKRALLDSQTNLESLRALSWKEFEWMVAEAYRRQGYSVEEQLGGGADGGIDVLLRKAGKTSLVQCKRWKTKSVGAPVIREMFGLLNHHQADQVIVVTSGDFTREAVAFADGKPIQLINGPALLELVQTVQRASTLAPHAAASAPVVQVPIPSIAPVAAVPALPAPEVRCPTCGAAMVKRTSKRGANAGSTFWGCRTYPTCRGVRASLS